MRHYHWGFFPYEAINYKAAQNYLDRKAAKGLRLKRVYLGAFAQFEEVAFPTYHFVDLDITRNDFNEPDREYLQLCNDGGWDYLQNLRGMFLFCSKPDQKPTPIQSDKEIEWEQFWEIHRPKLSGTLILLASFAFLAAVLLISPPKTWTITPILLSISSLLCLLFWVLNLLYSLLEWPRSKWYLSKCKQVGQVIAPSSFATVLDGIYRISRLLVIPLLILFLFDAFRSPTVEFHLDPFYSDHTTATVEACQKYPVVMAYDLGLPNQEDDYRHLIGRSSPLVDYTDYSELTESESTQGDLCYINTERYDCSFEFLAKWALQQRRRETENNFIWGALEWEPANDLGFDESYICRNGSYLLFREGNIVALVGCSELDLTSSENLAIIRNRILA